MDQHQSLKHFCRICKKGFGCGRALGGHMRAHGIGDEQGHVDDEDPASDWEEKLGNSGNKRMYALRTNPNRLKSCRICENCGKEFLSWKSFLEHGKCSSDFDSLLSLPESDEEDDGKGGGGGSSGNGGRRCEWSKGKRTRRAKQGNSNCPSSEEEDLANCLVMLSTARVDPLIAETEESCASASKDEERRNPAGVAAGNLFSGGEKAKGEVGKGLFECKACKKVFSSHQALGGHRASHKKVKGCFAAKLDHLDEGLMEEDVVNHDEFLIPSRTQGFQFRHNPSHAPLMAPPKKKSKVHECSICHRIFASGQALGGHKRCHWVTSNSSETSIAKLQQFQEQNQQHQRQRTMINKSKPLDLNLPAPVDDLPGNREDNETPLELEPPTAICLLPWLGDDEDNDNKNNSYKKNNNSNSSVLAGDDEADSKIKLGKLSDHNAMGLGSGSSHWLQVGIGSAANGGGDP